jgi:hypothetical protein
MAVFSGFLDWTCNILHTKLDVYLLLQILALIFPPKVYHGHVLLFLLLGKNQLIRSVARVHASINMSKRGWVHEFACPTLQRRAAAILGIKLPYLA